ncbi:MAG: TetR/AcrR family transcriptional regulator [Clostridia bacterium]|nr:TetR/AcrR family transcriptional regulator [Clostridia bacterium]
MKKGELKKTEILKTAEAFFCKFGYETTSVQDIIDELHTSKGSFYHHFTSKEVLLEEICKNRIFNASQQLIHSILPETDPVSKMNMLLSGMIPFNGEKLSFLLMLLPVYTLPEGVHLRSAYCKELTNCYLAPVSKTLEEGSEKGVFLVHNSEICSEIVIELVNHLWTKLCDKILAKEMEGTFMDPSELLLVIDQYRFSVERLVSAPYGSLEMIRLEDLKKLIDQIHQHWKQG